MAVAVGEGPRSLPVLTVPEVLLAVLLVVVELTRLLVAGVVVAVAGLLLTVVVLLADVAVDVAGVLFVLLTEDEGLVVVADVFVRLAEVAVGRVVVVVAGLVVVVEAGLVELFTVEVCLLAAEELVVLDGRTGVEDVRETLD